MKLAVFNGSPRGKNSNTKVIIEDFLKGFESKNGELVSYDYLIKQKNIDEQVNHFKEAENILIAFPLYTDSMPGIVKRFIEEIGNIDGQGKKILFLVQSGFSEAVHSEGVKNYLELLSKRWQMQCMGVMVKPGAEGVRLMPQWMKRTLTKRMISFGEQVASVQKLNEVDLVQMATPYKFSKIKIMSFKFMNFAGLTNFYWNSNLKKYKAYEHRFDAPYLGEE